MGDCSTASLSATPCSCHFPITKGGPDSRGWPVLSPVATVCLHGAGLQHHRFRYSGIHSLLALTVQRFHSLWASTCPTLLQVLQAVTWSCLAQVKAILCSKALHIVCSKALHSHTLTHMLKGIQARAHTHCGTASIVCWYSQA